ncbi:hypothetical protein ABFU82_22580 [Nocardioides sp. WV_118_6]
MTEAHAPDQFPDELAELEDQGSTHAGGPAPAAPGSTLASLRDRIKNAKADLHLDLEVPRLDPQVFVRFRPTTQARLNAAGKLAGKLTKNDDGDIIANAGILASACIGVFEVIDGEEVSVDPDDRDGTWPTFGPRLAELLGVSTKKASDVVRALYLTDGDIISTVTKLGVWSGYAQEQLERDPEGN